MSPWQVTAESKTCGGTAASLLRLRGHARLDLLQAGALGEPALPGTLDDVADVVLGLGRDLQIISRRQGNARQPGVPV